MKQWNQRQFLFINGSLFRKLQMNKSEDIFIAQNTLTKEVKTYSYQVIRDTHEIAYNIKEVSEMLNRSPNRVRHVIYSGVVTPQKQSYNSFKGSSTHVVDKKTQRTTTVTNTGKCSFYLKPAEVHALRDHFSRGFKYVAHNSRAVPTKGELEALLNQSVVLYVKAKDGSFVPTWQAKNF